MAFLGRFEGIAAALSRANEAKLFQQVMSKHSQETSGKHSPEGIRGSGVSKGNMIPKHFALLLAVALAMYHSLAYQNQYIAQDSKHSSGKKQIHPMNRSPFQNSYTWTVTQCNKGKEKSQVSRDTSIRSISFSYDDTIIHPSSTFLSPKKKFCGM